MPVYQCPNRLCVKYRKPFDLGPVKAGRFVECAVCGEVLTEIAPSPADPELAGHFGELLRADPEAALREVTARRELHWAQCHPGWSPDLAPDPTCPACSVIDHQWRTARRSADGLRNA